MTVTTINIAELRELIAGGGQVVEVLPKQDYEKLHLPGAISLPLADLNAETAKSRWIRDATSSSAAGAASET